MVTDELTLKAREIARLLSYGKDPLQATAKHMLLELAHQLDMLDVHVRKADGLLLTDGVGRARYATLKERVLYRLFGVLPRVV